MNKSIIYAFLMVLVMFIAGCSQQPRCNKPYILVGSECCLDQNDNSICDKDDETKTQEKELTCNPPYIKVGDSCCLDQNNNSICDKDETVTETAKNSSEEKETKPCGDGICSNEEDCLNCELDCGKCVTIQELKNEINKIYEKDDYIWKTQQDENNPNIKYHAFFQNWVIIAEITNEKGYMNDYDSFLNFSFNYNFTRRGEEQQNTSIFDDASYWEYVNESSLNMQTTMGKINENRGYWKSTKNVWIHSSYGVYCAPNIYIRLHPDWTTGFDDFWLGLNMDSFSNALNQFNIDSKKNIFIGGEILSKCRLRNKNNDNLYALQKKINGLLGQDYAYIFEDKGEIDKYSSYDDEKKVSVDVLKKNKLKDKNEFYNYIKTKSFLETKEITNEGIKKFEEESLFKDRVVSSYCYVYVAHSYEEDKVFDGVSEIEDVNEEIVESIYGGIIDYETNYTKGEVCTIARENTKNIHPLYDSYPYFIYEIDVLCKPDVIIRIRDSNFESPFSLHYSQRSEYIQDMKRYTEKKRTELLPVAKEIYEYCNNNNI